MVEILQRERYYIAVDAAYCVTVPRLNLQITDKQYYSFGNYVRVEINTAAFVMTQNVLYICVCVYLDA
jgi:hypothetical protein